VTEDEEDNFVPGKVVLSKRIVQVSAGDSHSAALTEEGDVYAWGTFKVRACRDMILKARKRLSLDWGSYSDEFVINNLTGQQWKHRISSRGRRNV